MKRAACFIIVALIFISLFSCSPKATDEDVEAVIQSTESMQISNDDLNIMGKWVGDYEFLECDGDPEIPDLLWQYEISIYEEEGIYYAQINVDGHMTLTRIQAIVTGDGNSIDLVFKEYLPDNMYELYEEGDILLSFEKNDSVILTYWGEMQPILESNYESGKVYFERITTD